MKRLLSTIILVCTGIMSVPAQTGILSSLNRDQYMARVKMIDEFFARFNREELRNDLGVEYSDKESNILLLFDLAKFNSKEDSGFLAIKEFAHHVIENNTKLHFEDGNWFAKIKCHGEIAKKNITFDMMLCVEERDSAMYRWAISDVEGDIFSTSRDKPHNDLFIMPNENEQFFMSIRKLTTETYKFIDDYVKSNYKASALSTFLALVRNNYLKIDAVSDIEFIFLQVPEYIFTVKHFQRESLNSGWLINSCRKISDEEKTKLLKKLH